MRDAKPVEESAEASLAIVQRPVGHLPRGARPKGDREGSIRPLVRQRHRVDRRRPSDIEHLEQHRRRELRNVPPGAHKTSGAAMKAFNADGILIGKANEAAGGQVVFHLHMHVMPRHDGVALLPAASRKEDVKVLEDNATKLIAALG